MPQKTKKCKSCKIEFIPIKSIQSRCVDCTIKHAVELEKLTRERVRKKRLSEMKERVKTSSDFKNELQKEVNKLVRAIDFGCECISCGKIPKKVNAGHFFSVGSNSSLRFNLFNIWLQCEFCNTYKHGNLREYNKRLNELKLIQYVADLPVKYSELKLNNLELIEATKFIRSELRNFELFPNRPIEQRIELREHYNTLLNFYK